VRGRLRTGESAEFGANLGGPGRADPLEDLQCLPQSVCRLIGVIGGQNTSAQAGQCVGLVPGAAGLAGQVQGLPVAPLSLREFTADPLQRPCLVERRGLATPLAEVAVDAQSLLQSPGRGWVITRRPPHLPEAEEGVGLALPVAEVAMDAQGLLQHLGTVARGQPDTGPMPLAA